MTISPHCDKAKRKAYDNQNDRRKGVHEHSPSSTFKAEIGVIALAQKHNHPKDF
jgi:hypothetical protein